MTGVPKAKFGARMTVTGEALARPSGEELDMAYIDRWAGVLGLTDVGRPSLPDGASREVSSVDRWAHQRYCGASIVPLR